MKLKIQLYFYHNILTGGVKMDVMQKFKNEFFEERKDLLSKNHVYRNHINKFVNYLSLPDVQLSNAPARININIVEECIRYYHNKGELNSRSTMESQLESVKSFYDYLSETGKTTDIFSDYNYSKFKDDIVDKYSLLEPVERGSYKCEDIKIILMELDKAIDNFQNKSAGIREEERHLQRIILRLFIKLTLIAPAKRGVITSIKKSDITKDYKKLLINGIAVNIPCGLSRDLCAALKYAESKNKEPIKEEDNFFEYLYKYKGKFRVESLNTWFYNAAQDFGVMEDECKNKKTLAVEPIKNMVIQMMVDNMINPVFISKIAGLTLTMIEATYYPKDWNAKREEDINKCINKSIAQNDYYCYV